jgi:hypothetical protein
MLSQRTYHDMLDQVTAAGFRRSDVGAGRSPADNPTKIDATSGGA